MSVFGALCSWSTMIFLELNVARLCVCSWSFTFPKLYDLSSMFRSAMSVLGALCSWSSGWYSLSYCSQSSMSVLGALCFRSFMILIQCSEALCLFSELYAPGLPRSFWSLTLINVLRALCLFSELYVLGALWSSCGLMFLMLCIFSWSCIFPKRYDLPGA